MRITVLLTGRGNNTLKDKNLIEICGHPVLYYPAHAAVKCKQVTSFYCSSDDERILAEAEKEGYKRILRPEELGAPTAQHVDVIKHALGVIEDDEGEPDILIVTLANNVTIKGEWIEACIDLMMKDMSISAVVPVYEDNDHHPYRAKCISKDGRLGLFINDVPGSISTNRQDLPKCFFLAHNFWVINVSKMIDSNYKGQAPWGFMGDNIAYFEIDESIDIHKISDIGLAEDWIRENWEN